MRAAVLQGSEITIETLPDPSPGAGEILVSPILTGICGSDLHFRSRAIAAEAASAADQYHQLPRIVPGHEFSATVVALGPDTDAPFRPGDRVAALPFTHGDNGFEVIGLSPLRSGGLATLSVVDAERTFLVPDEVPSDLAALAEPLAVGMHAANLANRAAGPNVVIGCGPVGLAVITALKRQGRSPIIAADFSTRRRDAAATIGADIVIDPTEDSPFDHWRDIGFSPNPPSPLLPRLFQGLPDGANVFECVGAPGLIDWVVKSAPRHSHVVVVGVCAHQDKFTPREAIVNELTLDFSFAYRPEEFSAALASIAEDPVRASTLVTSKLPLAETKAAFERLANQPDEIKILIDPHA
jgi:2-desacetyl-2-hydroxyethyl bacteriochlorophyllide A dehydrogenase